RSNLVIGPVRLAFGEEPREVIAPKRRRVPLAMDNTADLTFTQNLKTGAGGISIEGNISKVENFLKLAAAVGRKVNHGWELTGQATAVTQWAGQEPFKGRWNGFVGINRGSLTVAGLNQPLNLGEASLGWSDGRRTARLLRVEGFGGNWMGGIEEKPKTDDQTPPNWKFDLNVDHLNAAELDRWVGPRSRPNWLQRLLQSFLREVTPTTSASGLVRRVDAEGRLPDRLSGVASGNLEVKTEGVGREELLKNLDGSGTVKLKKIEMRGLDLPASVADGAARSGISRWPAGECAFLVRHRSIVLQWLQLHDPLEQTSVEGTLSFDSNAELTVSTQPLETGKAKPKKASAKGHVLKISGPLEGLHLTVEKAPEPQVAN